MDSKNIIADRKHPILCSREKQIGWNILALEGGKPYVNERLSKFPSESDTAFYGQNRGFVASTFSTETKRVTGRLERAYAINHCSRIATKLNQYIFAKEPKREGIDPDFAQDVTMDRIGINQFMCEASKMLTAVRWCWASVDGPEMPKDEDGQPLILNRLQQQALNTRPYWTLWEPRQVVDWCFDGFGQLQWLITEHEEYGNADPYEEYKEATYRTLWKPGEVIKYKLEDDKVVSETVAANPPPVVPFTPMGVISPRPWWFDDAEAIQRANMDLSSGFHETLFKQMYPQLILPAGLAERSGSEGRHVEETVDMLLGATRPVEETPEDKGITRYITPSGADIKCIPEQVRENLTLLFEIIGDAMRRDSAMVESADAKRMDRLDINAVLRDRARDLEEYEAKHVQLTKTLYPDFDEYEPIYTKSFDVANFEDDMKALLMLDQMELPDLARQTAAQAVFMRMREEGVLPIDDEKMQLISEQWDQFAMG